MPSSISYAGIYYRLICHIYKTSMVKISFPIDIKKTLQSADCISSLDGMKTNYTIPKTKNTPSTPQWWQLTPFQRPSTPPPMKTNYTIPKTLRILFPPSPQWWQILLSPSPSPIYFFSARNIILFIFGNYRY